MAKYQVVVHGGVVTNGFAFISDSRDSKKHLRNHGGEYCDVYTMRGKQISAARRWSDGTITNVTFGD